MNNSIFKVEFNWMLIIFEDILIQFKSENTNIKIMYFYRIIYSLCIWEIRITLKISRFNFVFQFIKKKSKNSNRPKLGRLTDYECISVLLWMYCIVCALCVGWNNYIAFRLQIACYCMRLDVQRTHALSNKQRLDMVRVVDEVGTLNFIML